MKRNVSKPLTFLPEDHNLGNTQNFKLNVGANLIEGMNALVRDRRRVEMLFCSGIVVASSFRMWMRLGIGGCMKVEIAGCRDKTRKLT